ncbi:MAG TPA: carboxypeptidase regulatory-like domain-containing protein, partial [Planctomycetaceae bacterium]
FDGTSNTLLVVEAKRDVPWTKPEDIPFDPEKADELLKQGLGGNHAGGFLALLADGSVRFISEAVDRAVFKGLVTPAGGEVIPGLGPAGSTFPPGGLPQPQNRPADDAPARPNDGAAVPGGVPVSGTVTLKGRPLAGATVTFVAEDGAAATAKTDDAGRYRIDFGPEGLRPGAYTPVVRGTGVPEAFTDGRRSPLRVEVRDGGNVFDFDLGGGR